MERCPSAGFLRHSLCGQAGATFTLILTGALTVHSVSPSSSSGGSGGSSGSAGVALLRDWPLPDAFYLCEVNTDIWRDLEIFES